MKLLFWFVRYASFPWTNYQHPQWTRSHLVIMMVERNEFLIAGALRFSVMDCKIPQLLPLPPHWVKPCLPQLVCALTLAGTLLHKNLGHQFSSFQFSISIFNFNFQFQSSIFHFKFQISIFNFNLQFSIFNFNVIQFWSFSTSTWVIRQHFLVSNFLAPPFSPIRAFVTGAIITTSSISTSMVELSRGIATMSQELSSYKVWVTNCCHSEPIGHFAKISQLVCQHFFTEEELPSFVQPVIQSQPGEGSVTDRGLTSGGLYPCWWIQDTACGTQLSLSVWQVELRRLPACPAAECRCVWGLSARLILSHHRPLNCSRLLSAQWALSSALVLYCTLADRPRPCNNTCIWHSTYCNSFLLSSNILMENFQQHLHLALPNATLSCFNIVLEKHPLYILQARLTGPNGK